MSVVAMPSVQASKTWNAELKELLSQIRAESLFVQLADRARCSQWLRFDLPSRWGERASPAISSMMLHASGIAGRSLVLPSHSVILISVFQVAVLLGSWQHAHRNCACRGRHQVCVHVVSGGSGALGWKALARMEHMASSSSRSAHGFRLSRFGRNFAPSEVSRRSHALKDDILRKACRVDEQCRAGEHETQQDPRIGQSALFDNTVPLAECSETISACNDISGYRAKVSSGGQSSLCPHRDFRRHRCWCCSRRWPETRVTSLQGRMHGLHRASIGLVWPHVRAALGTILHVRQARERAAADGAAPGLCLRA